MFTEINSKYHTFLTSAQDAKTQSNLSSGRLVVKCPSTTSKKGMYTPLYLLELESTVLLGVHAPGTAVSVVSLDNQ